MSVNHVDDQTQSLGNDLTVFSQHFQRRDRIAPFALFIRGHEKTHIFARDTLRNLLNDGATA